MIITSRDNSRMVETGQHEFSDLDRPRCSLASFQEWLWEQMLMKFLGGTECKNSAQCAPAKHHFDECVERVHQQEETDGEAKEDCVEECRFPPNSCIQKGRIQVVARAPERWLTIFMCLVFHLAHCASACAAPKLWTKLR